MGIYLSVETEYFYGIYETRTRLCGVIAKILRVLRSGLT
jgi:hypothetical protein